MTVVGILLAAGTSHRFGSDKRRAKLPDGRTLLEASLTNLGAVVDTLVLAVRQQEPWIEPLLQPIPNIHRVEVPDTKGLGDTLAAAVRYTEATIKADAALIALADMPWVKPQTLEKIIGKMKTSAVVVPRYHDRWGHPVGFQARYFQALMGCQGDTGARWLLTREIEHVFELDVDDPGIHGDIDIPSAIKKTASECVRYPLRGTCGLHQLWRH